MSETNQNTSLTQAINDMRTMRESYNQIAGAAEAYNVGKTQLAAAITSKGVETSPTESYPEMAEHVRDIQQTQTIIDGGDMYAAQLTGDGALWNLYDVLAQMKSQFMGAGQYACLIVCEYYKGYDSLQLQGADAYYTCDGDFYDVSSPLHVWHDAESGKKNRWVCFLFATNGARLDITNTAISPRSMYIGGHIGTIEYFVNGRLTDFVCGVEETDYVDNLLLKSYTQEWNNKTTIKGVGRIDKMIFSGSGMVCANINDDLDASTGYYIIMTNTASVVCINGLKKAILRDNGMGVYCNSANTMELMAPDLEEISTTYRGFFYVDGSSAIRKINAETVSKINNGAADFITFRNPSSSVDCIDIIVGAMTTDLRIKGWNPTNVLADVGKKAQLIDNIKNYILARVSDATGGTQLVFTVSTNMYNAIASETITWNDQTMTLADAFLTKNWLLAGA